jgi:tRNA A-37 threonylcarbamoyl transferase component Bud32
VVVKLFATGASGRRNIRRERAGYELARGAGVLCAELLGECRSEDGSYQGLIYELIENAAELAQAWQQFDVAQKRHWLGAVVRATLSLHRAGGYQRDIHLGNFLLKDERLYTLDLGSIAIIEAGKLLPRQHSLANLGQLTAQLEVGEQPLLDDAVDWYFTQRHWVDRKAGKEKLQELTRKAWRARLRDYLRKAQRSCSLTCFEKHFNFLWACRREWWGDDARRFLEDPDGYMAGGMVLKAGNTATVAKATMNGRPVVIKRYNIKNWRHAVGRALRPTRAAHSWRYAHMLELIGLPGLKPVALLERRCGPLRSCAYFISEWIEAPDLLSIGRRRALRAEELQALQSVLLKMEKCQLSHGDLKASNLLVDGARIAVIDLDAMRRHWEIGGFWRAFQRDLRRLQRNWKRTEPAAEAVRALTGEIAALQGRARVHL